MTGLWLLACAGGDAADSVSRPVPTDSATPPTADSAALTDSGASGPCAPVTGVGGQDPLVAGLEGEANVLILSIDTLRRDRVGRYSGLDTTPFLDDWLGQALVLDQHRSCSDWTASSMLCALSGTTPTEAGYEPHAGTDAVLVDVPSDLETLASWLAASGRTPAIVTANAVLSAIWPVALDPRAITLLDRAPAERVVDAGLSLVDSLAGTGAPWFLHLHFNDPHSPYDPPEAYLAGLEGLAPSPVDLTDEAAIIALSSDPGALSDADQALVRAHTEVRYQGELRYLDDQLSRLWAGLEARGVPDDTLVVLLTDHGEQFFEHGGFTHGMSLHAEEVDAVAALRAPGLSAGVWSGPTAHQDLVPTVLHALGLPLPVGVTAPIAGTAPADRVRHGFRQYRDVPPLHVITRGMDRMLYAWDGTRSFHDLGADPQEAVDAYASDDPRVACLWGELTPWIEQAGTFMGDYEPVDPHP